MTKNTAGKICATPFVFIFDNKNLVRKPEQNFIGHREVEDRLYLI